jgi:hypothetical protein
MYNYIMTSPHSSEREPSLRTVEVLAEHISNNFSQKWLDLGLHTDAYDLGKVKEGEYYRTAGAFTDKHGFTESQARKLVNFEIHRGFDIPHSAEFKLLASPMPSELLEHIALIQYDVSNAEIDNYPGISSRPRFTAEHASIMEYDASNPGIVSRIVLTRTVGEYRSIKRVKESTEKFLETLQADEHTSQEEVDDIRIHNLNRIAEWKMQLETIERLIEAGIEPLSPEEYTDLVEIYLIDLIKQNEDRLNPFTTEKHSPLPGSIALQAFFEQHTGKDFPK